MNTIEWQSNFGATEDAAITQDKGILLDFYNPDSLTCRQMEKDTYAQEKIIHFISEHLLPFRVNMKEEAYFKDFNITWVPSIVFLDKYARENHRSVGYLGPDDFIAIALLALGKIYSNNKNFAAAQYHFDKVLKSYPHSQVAEEAMYYMGINRYRETAAPMELKAAADLLQKEYPNSIWTRKAAPYRYVTEDQTV